MGNKSTALNNAVKISIIVGVLIVALSIAYYLVIFLPKKEQQSTKFQEQKQKTEETKEAAEKRDSALREISRKMELENCIDKAKDEMNNTEKVWVGFQRKNCPDGTNSNIAYQCLATVDEKLKEAVVKYDQAEKDCYIKFPQK